MSWAAAAPSPPGDHPARRRSWRANWRGLCFQWCDSDSLQNLPLSDVSCPSARERVSKKALKSQRVCSMHCWSSVACSRKGLCGPAPRRGAPVPTVDDLTCQAHLPSPPAELTMAPPTSTVRKSETAGCILVLCSVTYYLQDRGWISWICKAHLTVLYECITASCRILILGLALLFWKLS